ncbi:hypothetical protein B6D16_00995 [Gilliamella apicola]|uniref:HGGxSTG domain-containing protein n=1 Tax=Gilliamella apicola TaxID=1196095 RepID=UPI000A32BEED|nr:HGGxSTG domain-containing protein [Gilliamella apicola]OTP97233.1 hypothetical protein B6D05_01690 [Gilliamella apicola]OTQ19280.1 hypothetical protein B6D15_02455 [Gilliamella apicola]OTQ21691.1 hypothetical protein B6D16_00995 [Gilliamella apicola]OTQ22998.1 hypothetical protein B6D04_10835 [Gilliamella apicola]
MANLCGAKTRSGSPCQSKAMANGRCRMHGGKSTGAPKGNKNNLKAGGIYSQFLTDEEQTISSKMELGSLDEELKLCKIRLMRSLKAEAEQQAQVEELDKLELEALNESPSLIGGLPDNDELIQTKQFRRRDYGTIIDRLIARIESLETRRASLIQMSLDAERKELELDKLRESETEQMPIRIELVAPQT